MNWNHIDDWEQLRKKAREKWKNLSDADFDMIAGKREKLVAKLQELYGMTQHEAEREADHFAQGWFR
ncbi:MAG: CsbD family protein [Pseudomonadota bacterium]